MRLRHDTIAAVFDGIQVALVSNMLLVVGGLPLVLLAFTTDSARSWPLYALAAPLCAPGLCGVFAVMSGGLSQPAGGPPRVFWRTWRATARPAMLWAAGATAALVVLGVDARWAWGHRIGALALPVLAMLAVLTVATALLGLVAIAERPTARLRDVARACLYLSVRRWYLTAVSLLVLALLAQFVAARPALGLGFAAAPLLYVVWANTRWSLRPALDPA
ncbi:hypothetical protein ACTMTJ_28460 [Phytohabitans sp. LJ34]|uniref:hypothetical protein n=1 Tax=Phytohabitans sp. LJ34 TaxID=3452217 RepID=UPI003F88C46B